MFCDWKSYTISHNLTIKGSTTVHSINKLGDFTAKSLLFEMIVTCWPNSLLNGNFRNKKVDLTFI